MPHCSHLKPTQLTPWPVNAKLAVAPASAAATAASRNPGAPWAGWMTRPVGGVVSGGGGPPPPLVTSRASTTIQVQQAEALQVPVTLIITVCVPDGRPLAVYITACACWVGE